jgi:hypothetical protein
MSDELKLPDELRACEARLAGESLPPSRINRDELLYRAGWAAACAQALASERAALQPFAGRGTIAAWSLASAALAASLAVVVTRSVTSTDGPRSTDRSAASSPLFAAGASAPSVDRAARSQDAASAASLARRDDMVVQLSLASRRPPAALLVASNRRDVGRWDQPIPSAADSGASLASPSENVTAQTLFDELVPPGSRASDSAAGRSSTGLLRLIRPLAWGDDAI